MLLQSIWEYIPKSLPSGGGYNQVLLKYLVALQRRNRPKEFPGTRYTDWEDQESSTLATLYKVPLSVWQPRSLMGRLQRRVLLVLLYVGSFFGADPFEDWESHDSAVLAADTLFASSIVSAGVKPSEIAVDVYSDETLFLLMTNGPGALRLVAEECNSETMFACDLNFLSSYKVKPGFERYGGKLVMDQRRVQWIQTSSGATIRPADAAWDREKTRFRVSMLYVTAYAEHQICHGAYGGHLHYVANHTQQEDPIKLLLLPFTMKAHNAAHTVKYIAGPYINPFLVGFDRKIDAHVFDALLPYVPPTPDAVEISLHWTPWYTASIEIWRETVRFVEDYVKHHNIDIDTLPLNGVAGYTGPRLLAYYFYCTSIVHGLLGDWRSVAHDPCAFAWYMRTGTTRLEWAPTKKSTLWLRLGHKSDGGYLSPVR